MDTIQKADVRIERHFDNGIDRTVHLVYTKEFSSLFEFRNFLSGYLEPPSTNELVMFLKSESELLGDHTKQSSQDFGWSLMQGDLFDETLMDSYEWGEYRGNSTDEIRIYVNKELIFNW